MTVFFCHHVLYVELLTLYVYLCSLFTFAVRLKFFCLNFLNYYMYVFIVLLLQTLHVRSKVNVK